MNINISSVINSPITWVIAGIVVYYFICLGTYIIISRIWDWKVAEKVSNIMMWPYDQAWKLLINPVWLILASPRKKYKVSAFRRIFKKWPPVGYVAHAEIEAVVKDHMQYLAREIRRSHRAMDCATEEDAEKLKATLLLARSRYKEARKAGNWFGYVISENYDTYLR